MKPGIELDALIAQKVFGATNAQVSGAYATYGPADISWMRSTGDYECLNEVPHYSTDIAAAWEVVEKLKERDILFSTEEYGYPNAKGVRMFKFTDYTTGNHNVLATLLERLTIPHGICLAALQTVEESK